MLQIGDFSKMGMTTIKTLRYYDEIDLLKPESINPDSGYRLYSTNQLFKLHRIQSLRQIGLSICEIKKVQAGQDLNEVLLNRKKDLERELLLGTEQLSRIEFILSGKEEECFMNYQATIKELPECIVYSKKVTVPSYDSYFKIIPAIGEECKSANPDLKCTVPEYCFIIYLDGEYKKNNINIEFCEAVDKFGNEIGDIKFKKMEKITAITVMHKGSYDGLPKAYAYVFKWIEENGYTVIENPRESYIDGIWNKENPEEWLTELQVPIKKK